MFGDFLVNQHESDKYLGQILYGGGLSVSVDATVRDRMGKIKGAIRK